MPSFRRRSSHKADEKTTNPFPFVPADFIRLIESPKEDAGKAVAALGQLEGIAQALQVDLTQGLNSNNLDDLSIREHVFGRNYIPPPAAKSFFQLMRDAFDDITIIVLYVL